VAFAIFLRERCRCAGRNLHPGIPHLFGGSVRVPLCVCMRRRTAVVRERDKDGAFRDFKPEICNVTAT
jgi:hypothetical protein